MTGGGRGSPAPRSEPRSDPPDKDKEDKKPKKTKARFDEEIVVAPPKPPKVKKARFDGEVSVPPKAAASSWPSEARYAHYDLAHTSPYQTTATPMPTATQSETPGAGSAPRPHSTTVPIEPAGAAPTPVAAELARQFRRAQVNAQRQREQADFRAFLYDPHSFLMAEAATRDSSNH